MFLFIHLLNFKNRTFKSVSLLLQYSGIYSSYLNNEVPIIRQINNVYNFALAKQKFTFPVGTACGI